MTNNKTKNTIDISTGQVQSSESKSTSDGYAIQEILGDQSDRNLYHLPNGAKVKNNDGIVVEINPGWYRITPEKVI